MDSNNKYLHYGLLGTFTILYLSTAFVSFYHAVEFFNLSNTIWLAVILSIVAEIGQATVLFSLLMSKDKSKLMPWFVMIVLTILQVIGNVYSCYVYIEEANSPRFEYFQKSILFFVGEDTSKDDMKVIVAWITGSLLPIIALCLTSLVATYLHNEDISDNSTIEEIPEQETIVLEQHENQQTENVIIEDVNDSVVGDIATTDENKVDEEEPIQTDIAHIQGDGIEKQHKRKKITGTKVPNASIQYQSINSDMIPIGVENIEVKK